ncbi:MAG: hypothetical protein ACOH2L_14760 [Devosia sp.]
MADLTVVATLLSKDIDSKMSHIDLQTRLPNEPLTREAFTPLGNRVSQTQLDQIYVGVSELRRTFSSEVLTHFTLRRVNGDALARGDVMSEDAKARVESGGVLISLPTVVDFQGQGVVGRPDATAIDDAFKHALAQAVARIARLAVAADRDDFEIWETAYRLLGQRLQSRAALFNLNADHKQHHDLPALNWCETRGPTLLAAAYGLGETAMEQALDAAFKARLKHKSFGTVLADEMRLVETIVAWSGAHIERKVGEKGRRDSIRRVLKKQGFDWQTAPGSIEPPRMNSSVRLNLVAEKAMATLSTRAMVEVAILFDLEPAYSVFLTRLYLLPIFAAAGLAGRVGLRRQAGVISSPITAGGLLALAERLEADDNGVTRPEDELDEDEIGTHQGLVARTLEQSGSSLTDLAARADAFLRTEQAVVIDPPGGPKRFFLEG